MARTKLATHSKRVRGLGTFTVPYYITRIDSVRDDRHGDSHGWQVRYEHEGKRSKWFNDRGDPHASLRAATRYLESIYVGRKPGLMRREHRRKQTKLGTPGLRLVVKPNGKTREWSINCHDLNKGRDVKFYIGTDATATSIRAERALQRAEEYRREMLRERAQRMGWRLPQTMT